MNNGLIGDKRCTNNIQKLKKIIYIFDKWITKLNISFGFILEPPLTI